MSGSTGQEKTSFWGAFAITDRVTCEKAIRNGGIAAMVSAGVTAIFAGIGFFTSSTNRDLAYLLDPWMAIDVVLIVVLGLFIFRRSRVAATIMVLYYGASKAFMWYEMGKMNGVVLSVLFFILYVMAMRGTYTWHSRYKDSSLEPVEQQEG